MLCSLQIENYALIRSLQISFEKGMTVITGETGAGKSILMGALSLILGNRADTGVLLDHEKKCVVEAVFDISALSLEPFFEENDVDYQPSTIIRREIASNGKSRAFLNDTPVNLNVLKAFTSQLIDIHSQHQNLLFQNSDFRVNVIDEFAGIRPRVQAYQTAYAELLRKEKELAEMREARQLLLEKKDYLEFVYKELSEANLQPNEQEELEQEIEFLSHTESIKSNLFQSLHLLSDGDASVVEALREVKNLCASISPYHSDIEELTRRLDSSYIEVKDIVDEMSSLNDKVEYHPEVLEAKQQRLSRLYDLQQKHHVDSIPELIQRMNAFKDELDTLVSDEEKIENAAVSCKDLRETLIKEAKDISLSRQTAATSFDEKIIQKITQLGIPHGQFHVSLRTSTELQKNGIDSVDFLFTANLGFPLAEIEKVASGGEMSRLMLAVKSTISDQAMLPTIVFDEIDAGISGEVAGKMADTMHEMSERRQLLVITHLPQIAAKGHSHFMVYKQMEEGQSRTFVQSLDQQGRVEEIAKMMSGTPTTEATLQAARELLYS